MKDRRVQGPHGIIPLKSTLREPKSTHKHTCFIVHITREVMDKAEGFLIEQHTYTESYD